MSFFEYFDKLSNSIDKTRELLSTTTPLYNDDIVEARNLVYESLINIGKCLDILVNEKEIEYANLPQLLVIADLTLQTYEIIDNKMMFNLQEYHE